MFYPSRIERPQINDQLFDLFSVKFDQIMSPLDDWVALVDEPQHVKNERWHKEQPGQTIDPSAFSQAS